MTRDDLIERACEAVAGYLALGNERFEAHGATFVRNRAAPQRYDANHVGLVRTAEAAEAEALLVRIEKEFQGFGHRRFDIDPLTPPTFEARLALEPGYQNWGAGLFLALEGDLRASPRAYEVREVLTDADWRAYEALVLLDWQEDAEKHKTDTGVRAIVNRETIAIELPDFITYKRAKQPDDCTWLAYTDGAPVGFFSSWPGANGVGQIEDLFVRAEYRHRGIATALIAHCVNDARQRGAREVVIAADPGDTPKLMYAAMGFRPLFVGRSYIKRVALEGSA